MDFLLNQIWNLPSLSTLPGVLKEGPFPALITNANGIARNILAACIQKQDTRPLFILCPDDQALLLKAKDIEYLTGQGPVLLKGRELILQETEFSSRGEEQERLAALDCLAQNPNQTVIASMQGLLLRTLPKEKLTEAIFSLSMEEEVSPELLEEKLVEGGYVRTPMVEGPGQFSRRGGIIDIFTPGNPLPVRAEFWGNEIDSMGYFNVESQRREESLSSVRILPACESMEYRKDIDLPRLSDAFICGLDYLSSNALFYIDSPKRCQEQAEAYEKQFSDPGYKDYFLGWKRFEEVLATKPVIFADAFTAGKYCLAPKSIFSADIRQLPAYGGSLETALADVQRYNAINYQVYLLASDERRKKVMQEALEREGLSCSVSVGQLSSGLEIPELSLAILTDTQILSGAGRPIKKKKAVSNRERIGSCTDLSVGDLVVHEQYGIGRFAGIFKIPVDNVVKDYIKICYAGSDSLYVPATALDLVSKYIGGAEDQGVRLSKMGGAAWHQAKSRAKAATKELAQELTKLYAARAKTPGFAFSPDSVWQTEFEEAFGYAETDDQLRCISEIKKDMEQATPMDRLLCGDVGYGKTEVALRAAMKCILDGKQCVILVPTTVLARQHLQTATRRFFGYPVEIDMLTRFTTPSQKKKLLEKLKSGSIDLLIGTHRLLQKDVEFKDLGLLIVDEEQRFGVTHKEKLKEMSHGVDVLTLSATPIPRTLNMALSGLRSMSTIEEPPRDRQPVQTFVMEHDWGAITDAIRRELLRGGQVYYLHNRVENIERTALKLQSMLEGVNIAVAHGQMDEEQISRVMDDMVEGKIQVLVCTTIIETGIDIPNVNTLIIEDADRLGLAQLHQLRGRVGRSARRASAYFTYRRDKVLTEVAEKRLTAIREYAEFNAGIQIAMRDLEIRGAGNLLGAEQSGHMLDIGYDLYLKLLEEAVLEEKGETVQKRIECSADLSVSANIPESYVASPEQRMDLYRRIALIRTQEDSEDIIDEMIDRFGDMPPQVNTLVQVALLRAEAGPAGITDITQKNSILYFCVDDFVMERVSAVYALPEFKGRVKVEAGKEPKLGLKLKPGMKPLEEAQAFVWAWNHTKQN